jgi:hypothetical protein
LFFFPSLCVILCLCSTVEQSFPQFPLCTLPSLIPFFPSSHPTPFALDDQLLPSSTGGYLDFPMQEAPSGKYLTFLYVLPSLILFFPSSHPTSFALDDHLPPSLTGGYMNFKPSSGKYLIFCCSCTTYGLHTALSPWAYQGFLTLVVDYGINQSPWAFIESSALGHGCCALYQSLALDDLHILNITVNQSLALDCEHTLTQPINMILNQGLALDHHQLFKHALNMTLNQSLVHNCVQAFEQALNFTFSWSLVFEHTIQCSLTTNCNFSWWNPFSTSTLLELYARMWFTLHQIIVFIPQRYIPSARCQEISLHLRRHLFRKHDFAVCIKNLKGGFLLMVDMSSTLWPVVVYHILVLPLNYFLAFLLALYLVKATWLPAKGLIVAYSVMKSLV